MALGNDSNPIIKDSEPRIKTSKWGTLMLDNGAETTLKDVYTGGDAARGGSTAINAAGDGKAAAEQIAKEIPFNAAQIKDMVSRAAAYTAKAQTPYTIVHRRDIAQGIVEVTVKAPMVAKAAKAGQFVRVLPTPKGELIPLTLADWDAKAGTITLVIQGVGASSILINKMQPGEALEGVAGPLGQPSKLHKYDAKTQTVVFCAGGVGLPPVYPIARAHLRMGNHVTLIAGYRTETALFWVGENERVDKLKAEFGDLLDIIYCTNDGTFGLKGFVTTPLQAMLDARQEIEGPRRRRSRRDRPAADDEGGVGADEEIRPDADGGQPQLDHGRRHRHVRRLHGAGHDRRQDGAQARLHRRAGTRRPHHRLGQVPAALQSVQGAGTTKPRSSRPRLRPDVSRNRIGVRPKGRTPFSFPDRTGSPFAGGRKMQIPRGTPAGLAKSRDFRRDQAAVMRSSAGEGSRST